MKEQEFKNLNFSMFGKNSVMEGDFQFSGDTLINCRVKGNITMLDEGKLTFERNSSFEGNIHCNDIEVYGNIEGSITAQGVLSVKSSAAISGVINAKKLSIFPGAVLNLEGHTAEEE